MTAQFFANLGWITAQILLLLIMLILLAQNAVYMSQLFGSLLVRRRTPLCVGTKRDLWSLQSGQSLAVSIIAPAFNEELTIAQSIRSLLSINYPEFEIIVINDGSKDATLQVLKDAFFLKPSDRLPLTQLDHKPVNAVFVSESHPNLIVIDKVNGRKADASNAGISYAQHPLLCAIDADSLIESDALLRVTAPFLSDDGTLVAAGGAIRLTNGCDIWGGAVRQTGLADSFIARFQTLEYLRAFMVARVASSDWGMLMLISGAFGIFRRSAVISAGGYRHDTVGEDLELVVRLQRDACERGRSATVAFVPDAICWTEAPATYGGLSNQRSRWQQGALETLQAHRAMLLNRRYGRIGVAGMPFILLEDVLVPLAEALGYLLIPVFLWFQMTSIWWLVGMLFFSFLLGTALSIGALFQEEQQLRPVEKPRDFAILILCAFVENLGYRQFNTYCRLRGIKRFLGKETSWAAVPRVGFAKS